MIKKTITYTDYNGEERTEDFYFNLSRAEIIELEASVEGGLVQWGENAVATRDANSMMKLIKRIIGMSYGIKSPDGRRFMKSDEITAEFMETEAYSELLTEFLTSTDAVSDFFNGLAATATKKGDGSSRQNIVPMNQ